MVDLDALEDSVLAEYRTVSAPSSAAADALFERVLSTTALAAATTAGASAGVSKLLIAFAVATGIGGAGVAIAWPSEDDPPASATVPDPVEGTATADEPETADTTESEPAPEPTTEPAPLPPPSDRSAHRDRRSSHTQTPRATAPAVQRPNTAESIAAQTRLIRRADDALRRNRLAQAMAALLEYERDFPDGVLDLEARALKNIHACLSDLPGARDQAVTFVRQNPSGGLTERVRRACEEEK